LPYTFIHVEFLAALLVFAGKPIFVADAHRDDGNRFVVRADEI